MSNTDVYEREGVDRETVEAVKSVGEKYKYGFETEIEMEFAPKGLDASIVELISQKNNEPSWICLLYTSPSPRDATLSRMPSSA